MAKELKLCKICAMYESHLQPKNLEAWMRVLWKDLRSYANVRDWCFHFIIEWTRSPAPCNNICVNEFEVKRNHSVINNKLSIVSNKGLVCVFKPLSRWEFACPYGSWSCQAPGYHFLPLVFPPPPILPTGQPCSDWAILSPSWHLRSWANRTI